ncbi:MAG: ABC transporter permease [Alphaproteobacteria bacterium]|jgi:NitT/TauT family transport system permease protein|nr:ABC transporter permease [Alphaproteobacteria bacterium]
MIARLDKWCVAAVVLGLAALLFPPVAGAGWTDAPVLRGTAVLVIAVSGFFAWNGVKAFWHSALLVLLVTAGATVSLDFVHSVDGEGKVGSGFWLFNIALWAVAWRGIDGIAVISGIDPKWQRLANLFVPAAFGLWMIYLWEIAAVGFGVPQVLLPAPGMIGERFVGSLDILWDDFQQTFLKAVLAGYILGCGSGFLVSILVDRVPFLRRGLLPLGNLVSALPIVGVAPIMVMWFGFDWQSKAAVVVIMTFFPMLVNTVTGLAASGSLERDLLRSYGASYWQTLFKLRLPAALPFIFNALKINSTLALIGAIVAEFFGTPIVGMGFRISTEVGRMNVDMVWAEIVVAALAGSAFYGMVALSERTFTFWHPSFRERR